MIDLNPFILLCAAMGGIAMLVAGLVRMVYNRTGRRRYAKTTRK